MNDIELLTPDLKQGGLQHAAGRGARREARQGDRSGAINKVSWTGRWVETNGAFAAGNVGMHHAHSPAFFFIRGQGKWVNPETLGAAHLPGRLVDAELAWPRHLEGLEESRSSPRSS